MLWYAGFWHITSERFIVEPRGGDDGQVLVIDRVTQEISLQGQFFLCSFEKHLACLKETFWDQFCTSFYSPLDDNNNNNR